MQPATNWQGYALALLAVIGFSAGVVFSKLGLNLSELDFYSLAIWGWGSGMLAATLCFYLPLKSQRQPLVPQLAQHGRFFALISFLTIINGATWFYGMSQISGGVVALIDQNVLVWSFLLGALFLGERFSWQQLCAIALTLVGLGIVSSLKGEVTLLGVLALLTCGLCISLQSLFIKLYMALGSWLIWVLLGNFQWNIEPEALWWLFIGQFFGLFVGRAAYIKAHEHLPISQLSFFGLGIPLVVLLVSFVWLKEPISQQKLVGATVMLIGLTWFLTRRAKRQKG